MCSAHILWDIWQDLFILHNSGKFMSTAIAIHQRWCHRSPASPLSMSNKTQPPKIIYIVWGSRGIHTLKNFWHRCPLWGGIVLYTDTHNMHIHTKQHIKPSDSPLKLCLQITYIHCTVTAVFRFNPNIHLADSQKEMAATHQKYIRPTAPHFFKW